MALANSVVVTSRGQVLRNAEQGSDLVFSAIIAGIVLYFINKSFLGNTSAYILLIAGFVLTLYLGTHETVKAIGLALMTDGLYKIIKQYVVINNSS